MEELLSAMGGWTWWIVAAVLFALELLAPGVFFLWLGIAAILVGAAELVIDLPWQGEIAAFAILSIISLFASRFLFTGKGAQSDQPNLNRRMLNHVGESFVLKKAIRNGVGSVRIDDTIWEVRGPDAEEGTRVRVTGVDGRRFTVETQE